MILPRVSALVLLAFLVDVGVAAGADPFYLQRLEVGTRALELDDPREASFHLRIACFGFLDEPDQLMPCLARLAIAQSRARDESLFDTLGRALELERRFSPWADTEMPMALRDEFETLLQKHYPLDTVAALPGFAHLAAPVVSEAVPEDVAPEEELKRLRRAAAGAPGDVSLQLALARMELEQGRPKRARKALDGLLAVDPAVDEALCLRGAVHEQLGSCKPAQEDLAACSLVGTDRDLTAAQLRCLVTTESWEAVTSLLSEVPASLLEDPEVVALAARVPETATEAPTASEDDLADSSMEQEVTESLPVPDPGPARLPSVPTTQSAAPEEANASEQAVSNPLRRGEQADLAKARELLATATTPQELDKALRLAGKVADRHPEDRAIQFLAAEIAYRASRWDEAVRYFDRGGDPGDSSPLTLFYMSVALYERGRIEEAAEALSRALPRLERTPYVSSYAERILGTSAGWGS